MANVSFRQHPDVVMVPTDDGAFVLVDGAGTSMITLNKLGGLIWGHIDEPRDIDQIVRFCGSLHPTVPTETLISDAVAFLARVEELGLVVHAGE